MTDTKDLRDEFALSALPEVIRKTMKDVANGRTLLFQNNPVTAATYISIITGDIADTMMAERRSREDPQAEPWEAAHGYQEAFYKIAEILGVGALPTTPAQAFASVIVPKLLELMAAHGRTA